MPALLAQNYLTLLRAAAQGAADMPDLARMVYETGSQATRARLVDYLRAETARRAAGGR